MGVNRSNAEGEREAQGTAGAKGKSLTGKGHRARNVLANYAQKRWSLVHIFGHSFAHFPYEPHRPVWICDCWWEAVQLRGSMSIPKKPSFSLEFRGSGVDRPQNKLLAMRMTITPQYALPISL